MAGRLFNGHDLGGRQEVHGQCHLCGGVIKEDVDLEASLAPEASIKGHKVSRLILSDIYLTFILIQSR